MIAIFVIALSIYYVIGWFFAVVEQNKPHSHGLWTIAIWPYVAIKRMRFLK